jgi:hypothetical protein
MFFNYIRLFLLVVEYFFNYSINLPIDILFSGMTLAIMFQLVELSKAQDVEAGDGTTSVCVIAGSLLDASQKLLVKGGGLHVYVLEANYKVCIIKDADRCLI